MTRTPPLLCCTLWLAGTTPRRRHAWLAPSPSSWSAFHRTVAQTTPHPLPACSTALERCTRPGLGLRAINLPRGRACWTRTTESYNRAARIRSNGRQDPGVDGISNAVHPRSVFGHPWNIMPLWLHAVPCPGEPPRLERRLPVESRMTLPKPSTYLRRRSRAASACRSHLRSDKVPAPPRRLEVGEFHG